jgi:hypothetical protein
MLDYEGTEEVLPYFINLPRRHKAADPITETINYGCNKFYDTGPRIKQFPTIFIFPTLGPLLKNLFFRNLLTSLTN